MTHRNAEIWEKRHERLESLSDAFIRHVDMAYTAATTDALRAQIARRRRDWMTRWAGIEKRVWNALCVAKGWRKA
jgi:hypothetical protein